MSTEKEKTSCIVRVLGKNRMSSLTPRKNLNAQRNPDNNSESSVQGVEKFRMSNLLPKKLDVEVFDMVDKVGRTAQNWRKKSQRRRDAADHSDSTPDIASSDVMLMLLGGPCLAMTLMQVTFTTDLLVSAYPDLSTDLKNLIWMVLFFSYMGFNVGLCYLFYNLGCTLYRKWQNQLGEDPSETSENPNWVLRDPMQTRSGRAYGYRYAYWA